MNIEVIIKAITIATAVVSLQSVQAAFPGMNGQIAFTAYGGPHDTNAKILAVNPDGTGLREIIKSANEPSWSADGKRLAFSGVCCQDDIWVSNADGSGAHDLTNNQNDEGRPTWSPDGKKIAFCGDIGAPAIILINADGTNLKNLTDISSGNCDPDWSPLGTKIAFESTRDGNNEIYVMNIDGSNQTRLTKNTTDDSQPNWSPDGTKIVFHSSRDGNSEIYVMNSNGSNLVRLTNNAAFDGKPVWSPDGKKIAFESDRDGQGYIYTMNSDGSNQKLLVAISGSWWPSWQPIPPTFAVTGIPIISLGDVNNDRSPEIAVVTHDSERQKTFAVVKNAKNGAFIKKIPFDGQYAPLKAAAVNDLNGNGSAELALLGRRDSDQAVQVEVRDGRGGVKLSAVPFPTPWPPRDLAIVGEFGGAGTAALAVLQQSDTGVRVQLKDAKTGGQIRNVTFSPDYDGVDLVVLPDLNGNQRQELAVLGNCQPNAERCGSGGDPR